MNLHELSSVGCARNISAVWIPWRQLALPINTQAFVFVPRLVQNTRGSGMGSFDRRVSRAVQQMDREQLALLMIQNRLPNDVHRARVWPNMVGCSSKFITKEVYYFLS